MKATLGTITLILIQLFLIQAVFSQGLPTAKPEEVGMSSDRLNRINTVMQSYVDENILPGLITLEDISQMSTHIPKSTTCKN